MKAHRYTALINVSDHILKLKNGDMRTQSLLECKRKTVLVIRVVPTPKMHVQ
jgi:hypothetical protein